MKALLLSTMIGVGASVASAQAAPFGDPPQVVVQYRDLRLEKMGDVKELYRRIRYAAARVCTDFDSIRPALRNKFNACREKAIEEAVAKVDSAPLLMAYHEQLLARR
jgi:UrcA family protein